MRTILAIATLLFSSLFAVPSCGAQPVGVAPPTVMVEPGQLGVDVARNIAVMNGMVDIRKIEFYDSNWHVDGRDASGRHVWMTIDPRSGTIAYLGRD